MMSPMPVEKRLLEQLSSKALKSVRDACELVELKAGHVLSEPGERIREVYFPTESVVSLVATVDRNTSLEVALVGYEGMVGLPLLLGCSVLPPVILLPDASPRMLSAPTGA